MAPPLGELSPKVTERALSALRAPLPQGEASDKRHKHPAASQLIGPAGRGENRFSLLKYVIFPGGNPVVSRRKAALSYRKGGKTIESAGLNSQNFMQNIYCQETVNPL